MIGSFPVKAYSMICSCTSTGRTGRTRVSLDGEIEDLGLLDDRVFLALGCAVAFSMFHDEGQEIPFSRRSFFRVRTSSFKSLFCTRKG